MCGKSHDLDLILDIEEAAHHGKKRQRFDDREIRDQDAYIATARDIEDRSAGNIQHIVMSSTKVVNDLQEQFPPSANVEIAMNLSSSSYHSAHYDSYMTGYIFAHQLAEYGEVTMRDNHRNRLYLIAKDVPLRVERSRFTKTSKGHDEAKSKWAQ